MKEEIEARMKKLNDTRKIVSILATVASGASVAIAAAMFSFFIAGESKTLSRAETTKRIEMIDVRILEQDKSIKELGASLSQLRNEIGTLSRLPKGTEWKIEASNLSEKMNLIERKHQALEAALTTDTVKH